VDTRAVNRKVLEAFIRGGACDGFGETRATLCKSLERVLARAASAAQDRARGQTSLFGLLEEQAEARLEALIRCPEWPQRELLAAEKELLGFYVTGHPLTPFASLLERYSLTNATTLGQLPNRSMTRMGGLVAAAQQGVSKKTNKPYATATLEDLHGSVQVLCLNEAYDRFRELLVVNQAVLVIGEVNAGDEKPRLFVQEILPLEQAPAKYTRQVHLRLQAAHLSTDRLAAVQALVAGHPGKCPLFLCVEMVGGELVFIEANERFAVLPSLAFQRAVEELLGEGSYHAKVDASLPERVARPWERRAENGGPGD
jgi:DNA polymerase-3 subunit alpha